MANTLRIVDPGGFRAGAAVERGDLLQLDTSTNYPYVIKTAAATAHVIGVAMHDAASGDEVTVGLARGVYVLRSGNSISEGDAISPTSDGEVITAASAAVSCGQALEAATAADQEIRCLFGLAGWLLA